MKHSALNAVKYDYKKYREKNYAVHGVVLSAVKYKWFNPQVAFLQRPPSRNLNKIKGSEDRGNRNYIDQNEIHRHRNKEKRRTASSRY